jgi:hypothetical protein
LKKFLLLLQTSYVLTVNPNVKQVRPVVNWQQGEVTSLSGADKREVRDNREKW